MEFLQDACIPEEQKKRIAYVISHHHTCEGVDGIDWQILLEADYLVNAEENGYPAERICGFRDTVAMTDTGKRLLNSVFRLPE